MLCLDPAANNGGEPDPDLLVDIVIGIASTVVGGLLLSGVVDAANGRWWSTLLTATVGAAFLFWVRSLAQRGQ